MPVDYPIRVSCTECHYSRIVRPEDDELPADILTQHGQETGHTLTLARIDEDRDQVSP